MNLVLFGPPGAGKGTQSDKLINKYNFAHISTGDIFREHLKNETPLGLLAKTYMNEGVLVPDSVTIDMLKEEVAKKVDQKGFIYDGFPRTLPQAEALDAFLIENGQQVDLVIQLDVNQVEIKTRIAERQKVSGRVDDEAEKLLKRIDEYFEKTIHVLPFYQAQNKLVAINGVGNIDDIFADLCIAIDQNL